MNLQAVILVGGEGTRLRPLTERTPKPMVPLLDRPLLSYTLDHLLAGGVDQAVLACGYLPTAIRRHYGKAYGHLRIRYAVEPQPLGTGGAIAFAADSLGGCERTFLALNGDSLREADINALLAFHRARAARATILLAPVPDPSRYGLVRTDESGRVLGFLEKPSPEEIDTDLINAGLYVLEPDVLDLIPRGRAVSIEREVFPVLAERGELYALALPGYWLDVGTRESYLQAAFDLLRLGNGGIDVHASAQVSRDARLVPPVVIGANAAVDSRACLGPFVHVGSGASVGARAVLRFSTVLPQAVVEPDLRAARTIIAPQIGAV